MNAICHDPAGELSSLTRKRLHRSQQGQDPQRRRAGCGELNPIFLFSKEEEDDFKDPLLAKAVRDPLYIVNRRVVVYVFRTTRRSILRPGRVPIAREDDAKCRLRLWSDHPKRRNAGPVRREFGENMAVLEVDENDVLTEQPVDSDRQHHGLSLLPCFAVTRRAKPT